MDGFMRLGNVFDGHTKRVSGAAVPTSLELGTINSNLSLSTDSLGGSIPKGEYMIDSRLKCSTYNTSAAGNEGTHTHRIPTEFRALKSGDRVLVAWCGNEPIVIAVVVSS